MRSVPYSILLMICWLLATCVHAQEKKQSQARSPLEVTIDNQIEMQLNAQTATVVFNQRTNKRRELNGLVPNQFVVVSNSPYSISVTALTPYLSSSTDRIPMSSVSLAVTGTGGAKWISPVQALSTQAQTLSRMAPPTVSQPYSIVYRVRPLRQITHAAAGSYYASLVFTMTQE